MSDILTVPEAARQAGVHPETIRRWIWSGRLQARKIGNQHVIEPEALKRAQRPEPLPKPRPGAARSWAEWLEGVRETNRKHPVEPGIFEDLDDLLEEVRSGRDLDP
jgi:excisionase family DNA binding protein